MLLKKILIYIKYLDRISKFNIGNENQSKNYYCFSQSELNTTSNKRLEELKKHNIFRSIPISLSKLVLEHY